MRSVDLEVGGGYKWNQNRIDETPSERGAEEGLSEKAEVIAWGRRLSDCNATFIHFIILSKEWHHNLQMGKILTKDFDKKKKLLSESI